MGRRTDGRRKRRQKVTAKEGLEGVVGGRKLKIVRLQCLAVCVVRFYLRTCDVVGAPARCKKKGIF